MLLTIKQMKFLANVLEDNPDGKPKAKQGLSDEEKEELLGIDEMNFITYEEHLIDNFEELKAQLMYSE